MRYLLVLLLTFPGLIRAQTVRPALRPFPADSLLSVGVYYYPEHWPEAHWDRDLGNMARMGFQFTHFAEFAWAQLEPREGHYDFAWLDRAVDLAAKHRLKVILCTPSPAPPAWLTTKYPEVLVVNAAGEQLQHGGRAQGSYSSPRYRQLTTRLVTALAKRYGQHPAVVGWQLDNEPGHYGVAEDHNPAALLRFRAWLQRKYGSLDELNTAWGNEFWSGTYSDWKQVGFPTPRRTPTGTISPSAELDFRRFSADECAGFLREQQQALRRTVAARQWITTNFQGFYPGVDPWRSRDLDFVSFTTYPVSGGLGEGGGEAFRRGSRWGISSLMDNFRGIAGGVTGCMELQIGQVNWGEFSPRLQPGIRRAWLYNLLGAGANFVCSYRFRQARTNVEQDIAGMVQTDGVTPSEGGLEYQQFIRELRALRKKLPAGATPPPAVLAARQAGVLWNMDNYWLATTRNSYHYTEQLNYQGHINGYYQALKSGGAPVSTVSEDQDWSAYKFLVVPGYELFDDALLAKWRQYAQAGGHLVLTARTGVKNRNGCYFEAVRGAKLFDLIGAELTAFDNLPASVKGHIQAGNKSYEWNNWGETLAARPGTEVWATYADQFYRGSAAVVHRRLGQGTVTYVGVDTDDKALEEAMVRRVYAAAGVGLETLPPGIVKEWSHGFWVAVNYGEQPQTLLLPKSATVLMGQPVLAPAGVLVWRE
jgi:beta-galactosidase